MHFSRPSRPLGSIIDPQKKVGGWPLYRSAWPPRDSDGDGMPYDWETARGLHARDPSDAARDRDGDGYTNIEEHIDTPAAANSGVQGKSWTASASVYRAR